MSLSAEAQALFDHARQSLPRWLTRGKTAVLEWLHADTQIFDQARAQGQDWLDITYLEFASGAELEQHAADRGTSRREGEDDPTLRIRLRNITDAVTVPAIEIAVNALLAANGLGVCAIVVLRRDRAHCQIPTKSTSFVSRGYRMTHANRPMGYIVILPYGTSAAIGEAVQEILRLLGPGGYNGYVEIRQSP